MTEQTLQEVDLTVVDTDDSVSVALANKVESGEVLVLTDEEFAMVRCFRKFKAQKHKPGAMFRWQTHPETTATSTINTHADSVTVQEAKA